MLFDVIERKYHLVLIMRRIHHLTLIAGKIKSAILRNVVRFGEKA